MASQGGSTADRGTAMASPTSRGGEVDFTQSRYGDGNTEDENQGQQGEQGRKTGEGGLLDVSSLDAATWAPYKQAQSWYWSFFFRNVAPAVHEALCLICGGIIKCKAPVNLLHHLRTHHRKHEGFVAAQAEAENSRKGKNKTSLSTDGRNLIFMNYIVKGGKEYQLIESPWFQKMICGLTGEQKFPFPNRETMVEVVKRKAEGVQDEIRTAVAGKPLALACAGWESRAGNYFFSLRCNLVDDDGELRRYCLACRRLEGEQTGER